MKGLLKWLSRVGLRSRLRFAAALLLLLLPWALEYLYLEEAERAQASVAAQVERGIRDMRGRLATIEQEIASIEANREAFEGLVASGFVGGIDRLAARRVIEAASDANRLLGLTYQIGAEQRRPEASLESEGLYFVGADISVEQQAFLDADLFRFEQTLARDLPGILVPLRLEILLARRVGAEALQAIARGDSSAMVTGRYQGRWEAIRPMTPRERGEQ